MMIFYTDKFITAGAAGCARGPVILIRPEYRGDRGILAHEQTHVRQWWRTWTLHSWLYLLSPSYRLRAEGEAYREQLRHSPGNEAKYAEFISRNYGLDITPAEAFKLLTEE